MLLTHVELGNVQHFASLDHVSALEVELQRVCALPRGDELWTDEPASQQRVSFTRQWSIRRHGDVLSKDI